MEDRPPDSPAPPTRPYVYDAPTEPPATPPAGPGVIPWEEPGRPWLSGMVETIKLLFTSPRAAFERVPLDTGLLKPYVFGFVVGMVSLYIEIAFAIPGFALQRSMLPAGMPDPFATVPPMLLPMFFLCWPLFSTGLGIPFTAAMTHLGLMIVGGAEKGFGATFRAVCYAYGGAVLLAVPFCGGLLGGVAQMVFLAIGLSTIHRIGIGRAVIGMLLLGLVCCACGGLIALFVMSMSGAHPGVGSP